MVLKFPFILIKCPGIPSARMIQKAQLTPALKYKYPVAVFVSFTVMI